MRDVWKLARILCLVAAAGRSAQIVDAVEQGHADAATEQRLRLQRAGPVEEPRPTVLIACFAAAFLLLNSFASRFDNSRS